MQLPGWESLQSADRHRGRECFTVVNDHRAAGPTRRPPRDRSAVWTGSGLLRTLRSPLTQFSRPADLPQHAGWESYDYRVHLQTPLHSNICVFYCRSRLLITRRPWGSHTEAYLWPNQETEILNRAWLASLICDLWLISGLLHPQVFALHHKSRCPPPLCTLVPPCIQMACLSDRREIMDGH